MNHSLILRIITAVIFIFPMADFGTQLVNLQSGNPNTVVVFAQGIQNETLIDDATSEMSKNTSNSLSEVGPNLNTNEGTFVGAGDGIHNAEGIAKIIPLQDENKVLRLENLKVTNGPDLYVYLATDKAASDFVDLGRLKGNIGNQNYDVPLGTDLTKYDTVLIWCKLFSVLFGSAELTTTTQS